jgi:hypothetical protein
VVEVKGGKHYTKTMGQEADLSDSLDWLKSEFSGLDWDYMLDRDNGELLCDIGVTHHPEHSEPLVGLWRLDCLEASFGAGGYNRGNLHTLNTLNRYGGLQAEMGKTRAERTHIAF